MPLVLDKGDRTLLSISMIAGRDMRSEKREAERGGRKNDYDDLSATLFILD
jgi:hypothetical protein